MSPLRPRWKTAAAHSERGSGRFACAVSAFVDVLLVFEYVALLARPGTRGLFVCYVQLNRASRVAAEAERMFSAFSYLEADGIAPGGSTILPVGNGKRIWPRGWVTHSRAPTGRDGSQTEGGILTKGLKTGGGEQKVLARLRGCAAFARGSPQEVGRGCAPF